MTDLSRRAALAALAASAASPALAHGPSRLKVAQTVDVARTPDQVWALVGDFDSIARWHPAVASSPADHGNDVGSKRTLTLRAPGDPSFEEELVKYDAAAHRYQYRIEKVDPKILPVNNYSAWFELSPNDQGGATVEWRAAFYRGYMLNDPPPELNDDASQAAVEGVLRAGLDNIKKLAESAG
jgi:hypothetical protein